MLFAYKIKPTILAGADWGDPERPGFRATFHEIDRHGERVYRDKFGFVIERPNLIFDQHKGQRLETPEILDTKLKRVQRRMRRAMKRHLREVVKLADEFGYTPDHAEFEGVATVE